MGSALAALLFSPKLIGLMLLAIPLGIFFGSVPGLGGKLGIVLLIPFIYGMNPLPGAVFLLAMHSIVHTGGIVPSLLVGVPTNGPEAPLLVDGYPMVRSGHAGRALGAALGAAGIGGLIGVLCVALILPVVQPFVLSFSPIEFFWLAILGITLISSLAGKLLVQGLIVGCFGWLVGMIGLDPQTGVQRFTFNQLFLWDGFDVISGVLALYALPEMMQLARTALGSGTTGRGAMAARAAPEERAGTSGYRFADIFGGLMDIVRHWPLTVASSVLGTFIGMIPGLGGEAAAWMCYAFAASRSKNAEQFGKGAIEGVIAPSAGMNSKEGGGLLPTLLFGVPAGSGMAIMLGALIVLGIKPGPLIVVDNLSLVWSLIWTIAIANLICTVLLLAVGKHLGAIAQIRAGVLVPMVLVFALLGTFLAKDHWQSLLVFAALGAIGYVMRRHQWPRSCFIIGLVLGPTAERSYHQALDLYGLQFLLQPTSLVMIGIIVASLFFNLRKTLRTPRHDTTGGATARAAREEASLTSDAKILASERQLPAAVADHGALGLRLEARSASSAPTVIVSAERRSASGRSQPQLSGVAVAHNAEGGAGSDLRAAGVAGALPGPVRLNSAVILSATFLVIFGAAALVAELDYPAAAAAVPVLIGGCGAALSLWQLIAELRASRRPHEEPVDLHKDLPVYLWVWGFVLAIVGCGFLVAAPLMLLAYLRLRSHESWWLSLLLTAITFVLLYGVFARALGVTLFEGLLSPWLLQWMG